MKQMISFILLLMTSLWVATLLSSVNSGQASAMQTNYLAQPHHLLWMNPNPSFITSAKEQISLYSDQRSHKSTGAMLLEVTETSLKAGYNDYFASRLPQAVDEPAQWQNTGSVAQPIKQDQFINHRLNTTIW